MSCCEKNNGIYKGDDLIDLITIKRPKNTDNLDITKSVVVIKGLAPIEEINPIFPYTVSILRSDSINLSYLNEVHQVIYYAIDGNTYKRTCKGELHFKANDEVLGESNNDGI